MLLEEALGRKASINAREVFSVDLGVGANDVVNLVRNADIIISQPVNDGYRGVEFLSTTWISKNIKRGGRLLKVPIVYDRTHLPQCYPLARLHEGRLAYHDAHALDYYLRGASAEDFLRDTRRSDFFSKSFILSEAIRSLQEILRREREAKVDVPVSDSLAEALAVRQPMHSVNHPDRALLAELTNRLLAQMGRSETAIAAGESVLDHFVMPPYLSTALGLGHNGAGMDFERVRYDSRWESRDDYFKEVFSAYARVGREGVDAACAGQRDLGAYLQRFRRSRRVASEDPQDVIEAMYRGFFGRNPGTKEILYHLQVLKEAGFEALLGQFLTYSRTNGN